MSARPVTDCDTGVKSHAYTVQSNQRVSHALAAIDLVNAKKLLFSARGFQSGLSLG